MKIVANGINISYEISGDGFPLVLIHGAGDNLRMWYQQIPFFSLYYRVIAFDLRGHGETEAPDAEYSIGLWAEDLFRFMEAIHISRAYLIGYSMGGRIAFMLAKEHPELVEALVLSNTALGIGPSRETRERRMLWSRMLDNGDIAAVADSMTAYSFSPGFREKNPDVYERYRSLKLQNKPDRLLRVLRAIQSSDLSADLATVKCPVLLVLGKYDVLMGGKRAELAAATLQANKTLVLPAGHAAPLEAADLFNSAVHEFLSGIQKIA